MAKKHEELGEIFMDAAPEAPAAIVQSKQSAAEHAAELRAKRTGHQPRPLGGFVKTLDLDGEIPGYHCYICNDEGNKLEQALDHGYRFAQPKEVLRPNGNIVSYNNDLGDKIRYTVGKSKFGEPIYAYLLKIPLEIWEEDNAYREEKNLQIDRELQSGNFNAPKGSGLSKNDLESMPQHSSVRTNLGLHNPKFILGE
jgi:hypothetical protein